MSLPKIVEAAAQQKERTMEYFVGQEKDTFSEVTVQVMKYHLRGYKYCTWYQMRTPISTSKRDSQWLQFHFMRHCEYSSHLETWLWDSRYFKRASGSVEDTLKLRGKVFQFVYGWSALCFGLVKDCGWRCTFLLSSTSCFKDYFQNWFTFWLIDEYGRDSLSSVCLGTAFCF